MSMYEWLCSKERELHPFNQGSFKGKAIRWLLHTVWGGRYWKDVWAAAVKKLKAQHAMEMRFMKKREKALLTAYLSLAHPEEYGIYKMGNQTFGNDGDAEECLQHEVFELSDEDFLKTYENLITVGTQRSQKHSDGVAAIPGDNQGI